MKENGDGSNLTDRAEKHLGLVWHVARKTAAHASADVDAQDLVGPGTMGLMDALERYEPELGYEFSTFAATRIRGAILTYLRNAEPAPRSVQSRRNLLRDVERDFIRLHGRPPTDREIADELETDTATVSEWRRREQVYDPTSLHAKPGDDSGNDGLQLQQLVPGDTNTAPGQLSTQEQRQAVQDALGVLDDREQLVVWLYYFDGMVLREIGDFLGVGMSRASQIKEEALEKLRPELEERLGRESR